MSFDNIFKNTAPIKILNWDLPLESYCLLDLSKDNLELTEIDITQPDGCQHYINKVLERSRAKVAYGGYLEQRNLYAASSRFAEGSVRNIHLGMDFWCAQGTSVITPLKGKVHSFKNNSDMGNYGPTIILEHQHHGQRFYSLYGHLSLESLEGLYPGKEFLPGQVLGTLGSPEINVNYAPHLHFQLIKDIQDYVGDYPGVCSANDITFYKNNCPDPNSLLKVD